MARRARLELAHRAASVMSNAGGERSMSAVRRSAGTDVIEAMPSGLQTDGTMAVLNGGARVLVRPLTPADREAYLAGFERLGPESRRLRFLGPKRSLSDAEIRYFIDVDHHDHEAIAAFACGEGLGVARYIRDRHHPRVADVAVAVIDTWQRRGLGSVLLHRIAERAIEEGVHRLRAQVLSSNRAMFATIRRLRAATITQSWSQGVMTLEISLDGMEISHSAV